MRNTVIVLGLGWALALSVYAQEGADPFERAMTAYGVADYAQSYELLRSLCDQGHSGAQALMGVLFFRGHGVDQSDAKAALWFYKAARRGNAKGQLAFGSMRWRGVGVGQDTEDALKWLMLASQSDVGMVGTEARDLIPLVQAELSPARLRAVKADVARFQPLPSVDR